MFRGICLALNNENTEYLNCLHSEPSAVMFVLSSENKRPEHYGELSFQESKVRFTVTKPAEFSRKLKTSQMSPTLLLHLTQRN